MEEIITYEILYDLLRTEKYEKELQKLDPDFFQSVIKYLGEKEAILESQKSKDSVFLRESEKTQKQLENIRKILREIYEKRENKIVQLALISSRFNEENLSNMLSEEIQFYKETKEILNKYREGILDHILLKKVPEITREKKEEVKIDEKLEGIKMIRLLESVPQFIGDDLVLYGPFEKEDVASFPAKLANLLIKKNKAEEIKTE